MAKILIVDDEIGIRELLSEILRDEGHDILLAENAAAARAARNAVKPDKLGLHLQEITLAKALQLFWMAMFTLIQLFREKLQEDNRKLPATLLRVKWMTW